MAEIVVEAQLHSTNVKPAQIDEFLFLRDQLLRNLATESGRKSAFAIALDLLNARNNPDALEVQLCAAFSSLGFEVTPIGGRGKPDGVATAVLSADAAGKPREYKVSLEAKSKEKDQGKIREEQRRSATAADQHARGAGIKAVSQRNGSKRSENLEPGEHAANAARVVERCLSDERAPDREDREVPWLVRGKEVQHLDTDDSPLGVFHQNDFVRCFG